MDKVKIKCGNTFNSGIFKTTNKAPGYCCKEAMEDDYFPSAIALLNPPDHCPYCGKKIKNNL